MLLACGALANISDDDKRRTVAALPGLLIPGGVVIWIRGHHDEDSDPSYEIRAYLAERGFPEMSPGPATHASASACTGLSAPPRRHDCCPNRD